MVKWDTNLVCNDWHIPFEDKRAVELFYRIARDIKPDVITINGDMFDFYGLSYFTKDPTTAFTLQKELNIGFNYLQRLREENPKSKIYFVDGNHEYRLSRFLMDKAPELYGLRKVNSLAPIHSLESLLCFDKLKIKRITTGGKQSYYWYGNKLQIGHYNKCNKNSGYTAKNLLGDKHISLIQGHTHRLGSSYKTVMAGEGVQQVIVAFENGCLCDLNPEYVLDPNWQQGFTIVKKKRNKDRFAIQQIAIIDYTCFYGETEYGGNKKATGTSVSGVSAKGNKEKGD